MTHSVSKTTTTAPTPNASSQNKSGANRAINNKKLKHERFEKLGLPSPKLNKRYRFSVVPTVSFYCELLFRLQQTSPLKKKSKLLKNLVFFFIKNIFFFIFFWSKLWIKILRKYFTECYPTGVTTIVIVTKYVFTWLIFNSV